ncbi:unnamed protein product [Amoebophrya sp. A120]|nr:unnamed protein product [Amoebophrya sp. A120]|eukprot:GSA120T00017245001.1
MTGSNTSIVPSRVSGPGEDHWLWLHQCDGLRAQLREAKWETTSEESHYVDSKTGSTYEGDFDRVRGGPHGSGRLVCRNTSPHFEFEGKFCEGEVAAAGECCTIKWQWHRQRYSRQETQTTFSAKQTPVARTETYEGAHRGGLRHGHGVNTIKKHGTADIIYHYQGEFCDGMRHGRGKEKIHNASTETVPVPVSDLLENTTKKVTEVSVPARWSSVYEGEWKNSAKCGFGKYQCKSPFRDIKGQDCLSQETYQGQWEADLWHGHGECQKIETHKNSAGADILVMVREYCGMYERNKACGAGVRRVKKPDHSSGNLRIVLEYDGEFKNGEPHGHGKKKELLCEQTALTDYKATTFYSYFTGEFRDGKQHAGLETWTTNLGVECSVRWGNGVRHVESKTHVAQSYYIPATRARPSPCPEGTEAAHVGAREAAHAIAIPSGRAPHQIVGESGAVAVSKIKAISSGQARDGLDQETKLSQHPHDSRSLDGSVCVSEGSTEGCKTPEKTYTMHLQTINPAGWRNDASRGENFYVRVNPDNGEELNYEGGWDWHEGGMHGQGKLSRFPDHRNNNKSDESAQIIIEGQFWHGDCPNEFCRITKPKLPNGEPGFVLEGPLVNGKIQGRGVHFSKSLSGLPRYEGEFLAGLYHGEGVLTDFLPDRRTDCVDQYKGRFRSGYKDGYGESTMISIIEGRPQSAIECLGGYFDYFKDDRREGSSHLHATYLPQFSEQSIGEWKNNKIQDGRGFYKLKERSTSAERRLIREHEYSGDYLNGKRHGRGRQEETVHVEAAPGGAAHTPFTTVYDGEWRDGKRYGRGTATTVDGDVFTCLWEDDKPAPRVAFHQCRLCDAKLPKLASDEKAQGASLQGTSDPLQALQITGEGRGNGISHPEQMREAAGGVRAGLRSCVRKRKAKAPPSSPVPQPRDLLRKRLERRPLRLGRPFRRFRSTQRSRRLLSFCHAELRVVSGSSAPVPASQPYLHARI